MGKILSNNKTDNKILFDKIMRACEKKGWSLHDLADKYDEKYRKEYDRKQYTIYNTLKKWNKVDPSFEKVKRIADILECDLDYLAGYQGDELRKTEKYLEDITGLDSLTWGKILVAIKKYPHLKGIIHDFLFSAFGNDEYLHYDGISNLLNEICTLVQIPIPHRETELEYNLIEKNENCNMSTKLPSLSGRDLYNILFFKVTHSLDIFIRQQRRKYDYQDDFLQNELEGWTNEEEDRYYKKHGLM